LNFLNKKAKYMRTLIKKLCIVPGTFKGFRCGVGILSSTYRTIFVSLFVSMFVLSCGDKAKDETGDSVQILTRDATVTSKSATVSFELSGDVSNYSYMGVCWNTDTKPVTGDNSAEEAVESGKQTMQISGLEASTTYYARAYLRKGNSTVYGNEVSFTTLEADSPNSNDWNISTSPVDNITFNSAVFGGSINSPDGVSEVGVCWNTSEYPTVDHHRQSAAVSSPFSCPITGLTPNTVYFVRAYAIRGMEVLYGNTQSFYTEANNPDISSTISIDRVWANRAECDASIYSLDRDGVSEGGICWSSSGTPTVNDHKLSDLIHRFEGLATVTVLMTELTPTTVYFVRVYVIKGTEVLYGSIHSFKTDLDISTGSVSNITANSATCGGNIGSPDGISEVGICWSSSGTPTVNDHRLSGNISTSFTCSMTGLTPNTAYYVRAYAIKGTEVFYGNTRSFKTEINSSGISTKSVGSITASSATCGGNIGSLDGVSEVGICWSSSGTPTINGNKLLGNISTSFTCSMTGLTPNTVYYVRAYAIRGTEVLYGNTQSFQTEANSSGISTGSAGNITANSATCGGNIGSVSDVSELGICWSSSGTPTVNGNKLLGNISTSFTCSMTGLTPNTVYYVRAYAIKGAEILYGDVQSFKTEAVDFRATVSVSNITLNSAAASVNISKCNISISERGVCYSTSGMPTVQDYKVMSASSSSSFSCTLNNLSSGNTYYVRAYIITEAGTYYGDVQSFKAVAVNISLSTTGVSSITHNSATSGGNISNCNVSISERGVCYSTGGMPTVHDYKAISASSSSSFSCTLSNLSSGSTYYARAYIITEAGTYYGDVRSFTTPYYDIGQLYGGGMIGYLDQTGQHGIIVSSNDIDETTWGSNMVTGATASAIGTGLANTKKIIATYGNTGTYAALMCDLIIIGGYDDWILPSKDDLVAIRSVLPRGDYWTSTEYNSSYAYCYNVGFPSGSMYERTKSAKYKVRAIRYF
jgi:hypothetical protein